MAEEIIISDLEQAPLLTDDMVLAVEDTKNTYSATLGQLRELINKLFVEKENIDFNTLTDDGFYQVSGTLTNAPVAGSITWIVQVVKVGNVIVQNAMATDASNYKKQLVRRYNGTSWESWEDISANSEKLAKLAENNTFTGQNTFNQNILTHGNIGVNMDRVMSGTPNIGWNSQNEGVGRVYSAAYYVDGNLIHRMFLENYSASNSFYMDMIQKDDGNVSVGFSGTPYNLSTTANGFEVPTAKWVKQVAALKDLSNATTAGVGSGYVYIGDLLIQWGQIPAGSISPTPLHKPYANKDYTVLVAYSTDGAIGSAYGHCNAVAGTVTEFKWNREIDVPLSWVSFGMKGA